MASRRARRNNTLGTRISAIETDLEKASNKSKRDPKGIDGANLTDSSVTGRELAVDSVSKEHIRNGAVGTEELGVVQQINSDGDLELGVPGKLKLTGAGYTPPASGSVALAYNSSGEIVPSSASGGAGVAVGTIVDWPREAPLPSNIMEADGSAISRSTFNELFGLIGTTYGSGDGSTTFNIPDLRWGTKPTSVRLLKTGSQSTSATAGAGTVVTWNSDSRSSGMWTSAQNSRVYPNRRGRWRVRVKLRGSTTASAALYVHVRMNGVANAASEGLITDGLAGPYPHAEDVFEVTNPGTDYFDALVHSTGVSQGIVAVNSMMLVDYLGPLEEYTPDSPTKKAIVVSDGTTPSGAGSATGLSVGMIIPWPGVSGTPIPANTLELNGQTVSKNVYSALAAMFPSWVSGDNLTLPDLRGYTFVGHMSGDDKFGTLGGKTGSKTHTLSVAEMPSHNHKPHVWSVIVSSGANTGNVGQFGVGNYLEAFNTDDDQNRYTGNTGGGGAHNNVQPSYVGRWLIVAADSAGDFSPTVQAALVGQVEKLARVGDVYRKASTTSMSITSAAGTWQDFPGVAQSITVDRPTRVRVSANAMLYTTADGNYCMFGVVATGATGTIQPEHEQGSTALDYSLTPFNGASPYAPGFLVKYFDLPVGTTTFTMQGRRSGTVGSQTLWYAQVVVEVIKTL